MEEIEIFETLEEGDRILFNDRQVPLEVAELGKDRVHVNGPQGGEYILFEAEEQERLLVATKGRREYASYVEGLRKVGKWEQRKDTWTHSKTGAEVRLEKNEIDRWTVDTSLDADFAPPKYGYADREAALEDAKNLVGNHPEGELKKINEK